jgi:hypothetical protein
MVADLQPLHALTQRDEKYRAHGNSASAAVTPAAWPGVPPWKRPVEQQLS